MTHADQPQLTFDGNCEEAFASYAAIFGATPSVLMRFKDLPGLTQTPESWGDKVMHAQIDIGGARLMGSDRADHLYDKAQGLTVSITVDTPEEAERFFAALSEGGKITMPMAETFWEQRFGMVVDRFDKAL
ncbi:VOC family protein [Rhodoblastus sp.]|uniref:VOC family protein n=1 Tax=Rhodoblastus sp. TaxID=1962975 RepID=UPI003F9E11ED